MSTANEPIVYYDKIEILKVLQRIQKQRCVLQITIGGYEENYSSFILKLGTAGILIDQLNPRDDLQLKPGNRFSITAFANGVRVEFQVKITRVGEQDGDDFYITEIPKELTYHQLRQLFRADIPRTSHHPVTIIRDTHEEVVGELHDISNGGVSIREVEPGETPFYNNEIIPECIIDIGEENRIYCSIELRRVPKEQEIKIVLGGQFLDMDPTQQRMIERFVTQVERERRKTLAGG